MQIKNSTVLVTGANRGIGAEFVRQLTERGARKVYAGARRKESIDTTDSGVIEALRLDVTNLNEIEAAAEQASNVDLVINNAGIGSGEPLMTADLDVIRCEFETNTFGPLMVARAFASVLAANGGGAMLNVLSASAWISAPGATIYSATKAATWSLTDGIRLELASQGTQVLALHMGMVDTDMVADIDVPKSSPVAIVTAALDALEAGAREIVADDVTIAVKESLSMDPAARYQAVLNLTV